MSIDIFGFRALWSPYYLMVLICITIGYFLFATKYRHRVVGNTGLTNRQVVYFLLAMLLLYVVKGSPVDLMSHIMFSAHMTQMAVLYLVIPPLFIIAIPNWIWRMWIDRKVSKVIFSFFTNPLIALLVFNSFFSLYHLPLIFDVVKTNIWLHAAYTMILFITAVMMWFPLVNKLPERQSLSGVKKIAYIFGSGILMTPACALIIFANAPMYSTFSNPELWANAMRLCVPSSMLAGLNLNGPEMFSGLPALQDQQLGGILMKIIQEIVLGYVLGVIFFAWAKKENGGGTKIDPLPSDYR
ncbi:cytochrome c oxidase assembly factor CtaG [Peribacillus asahii]|uniref:Cytochrome C oxidase assembly protein n=1 Tax=Peribacillus asahii TaxID=228899 RepID=A0A3T0KPG3_9BACI|nr:cytochrome c oxidase assembly factor CtaG [Peribacillus asahii]AZV42141.1 cytochrome C oxidase assembly protein [Peribacillus asahii]USK86460.1 cytochrome c oxidase assembly factor CtaG [Peribacillus asahii]